MSLIPEPCLCGADDCTRCFPECDRKSIREDDGADDLDDDRADYVAGNGVNDY